ncbi:hypothetical protein KP509_20G064700 [Ceratopteris richardii]|uniref:Uncharacterized protein n=1 Tax=Ceratopteris richardii TaxID=49495 RepID=A0A8T2SJG3_CERRI|nr:hypothetical protein KP509_20G064700 [Ceratopteris richardii]
MDFINSSYVERCRPSLRRSSHDFSSFYTAAAECSSFSRPHTQSSFISEFVPAREQLEEKDFCFVC